MQFLFTLVSLLVSLNICVNDGYEKKNLHLDCFLGAASCIIRLLKSTILNVIFMARLDWSFLGRPLEKFGRLFLGDQSKNFQMKI